LQLDHTPGFLHEDIAALMRDPNHDYGTWAPLFVRLAWHASGTFDPNSDIIGGSNGATMRFKPESSDGANNGLGAARDRLEIIKAKYPYMSYGDIWTLAAVIAVRDMGGPDIPWRAGRVDAKPGDPVPPNGRLPDAAKDADHIRELFVERMGFTEKGVFAQFVF
jgi:catalase (peroxidase I)